MDNRFRSRTGRALSAALLAGSLGACDFIDPTTSDPNNVANASVDQLFTGIQVNMFYLSQSIYARIASMWTQQTAGVTSQFTGLDQYKIGEDDFDDEMSSHYVGGGLIDIRNAIAAAEEDGRRTYAGVLKVHEAWYIGTAADMYGDVPYSEAVDAEITEPKLDPQLEVYAAVQAKLDEAIADLRANAGAPVGAVDLNFGGNAQCWIQVANSLKARYYLHTAEVTNGAYAQALAAAQNGISSNACNWVAVHSGAATENNIWYQFTRDRPDHIVGGFYLINLMNNGTPANTADDDPRLALYFEPARGTADGQFLGSRPGSPAGDVDEIASPFNTGTRGVVSPEYDQPIISCWETQFIIAEAQARAGNAGAARDAANRALACQEAWHSVTLPDIAPTLAGGALLDEILEQKYIAQFLNIDVWADYQRTCYPRIQTFEGSEIPGRALYGTTERQTNTKIPTVGQQRQKPRNANDPNPCPSA